MGMESQRTYIVLFIKEKPREKKVCTTTNIRSISLEETQPRGRDIIKTLHLTSRKDPESRLLPAGYRFTNCVTTGNTQ
jgi:hypothetical protein